MRKEVSDLKKEDLGLSRELDEWGDGGQTGSSEAFEPY
jgi:hypothetical protein